ncbi:MAG: VOC family protein [Candidatus Eremiobacteraeota bacterium]|nr:VOC family protein [Candidatus Eremiobacteraeota bacterium]
MADPVVYFEIVGNDAPALRAFYSAAFGWQIGERMPGAGIADYTLIEPARGGVAGGIGAAPNGYDGHITFYVAVADVARALEAIEKSGGKRMMGPERVPGGPIIALFRDPEGRVVGLTQSEST